MHRVEPHTPLYNSRIIDTYLQLLKERYPQVDTGRLLAEAGLKPYEVADQGHWFTQAEVDRFHERLTAHTGNPDIAREAGRFAASPQALGIMRQYALGLLEPGNVFSMLDQAAASFSRSALYTSQPVGKDRVLVTVTPREGVQEQQFQCENRIGFFEAIPLLFRYRVRSVEHTECIFRGGSACRYEVSWQRPSESWRRARDGGILALTAVTGVSLGLDSGFALATALPAAACAALLLGISYERVLKRELKNSLSNFKLSTDKLLEQVDLNYNNTLLASEIGQAISRQSHADGILDDVVRVLQRRLDYSRGMILLTDPQRTCLTFRAGFGYEGEQLELLRKSEFRLDRPESKGIFVVSYREQRPFLINDVREIESDLSMRSLAIAQKLGVRSFICCPILSDGESIGILAADNIKTDRSLVQSDLSLLTGIATFVGISLHNAELLEASGRQSNSILQILASSIDARDPLTAGHSEKVTAYALGICDELGLPQNFREMIRVASLLHDYGKIGVPDAILKKEGRLSPAEYEIVKTHAGRTREILEGIHFTGIFKQVPEIAGAHHEKLDGSGYPLGLSGRDIPLGARIIAVADYFEAITAKRHYREPMPLEEAFSHLRAGSGSHFEERLVEAFISHYCRTYGSPAAASRPRPHQERRRPRIPYRSPVSLLLDGTATAAISADLSLNGIFLASRTEPHEGMTVELAFPLPTDRAAWVRAKGRVAWVNGRRERKKPTFPVGFGVEFVEMGEGATEAIQSFVGSCGESSFAAAGW